MSPVAAPTSFPVDGRRVIFYLFYDPRGIVDEYVTYKLERLRDQAEHIFVVVNGELTDEGRVALESVADTVWQRPNVGFDVWGYKSALEEFGPERLSGYDELILMNYTFFGPVRPFEPVFERMNALEVDFWGMTVHGAVDPNPYTLDDIMHAHIQSHWIAVRRSMFTSAEWAAYWGEMPMITSYVDSILGHESKFTHWFETLGFTKAVAFPPEDYPAAHPAFDNATMLLDDGCPVLKRRPFFHEPLYLDREAIIGRWLIESAESYGYPTHMILENMAHNAQPKVLNTNASMLEILPEAETEPGFDRSGGMRIAAVVHIFYDDMTDELLDKLETLPTAFDLYVTTTDEAKATVIREAIDARRSPLIARSEVRVMPSNRGRDLSGFFVAARDVLIGGQYDIIVKIHSKKTVQQAPNAGYFFKRQQFDNLLNSPGYTANLLALFQREPGLGLVFPPTIHIGYPTLGGAWFANREPAAKLFKRLGIRVPLDGVSPLAPFGAMFIARPEALRLLTEVEWKYEDYDLESNHTDGSLAHVQERAVSYAAGELGYHTRTVANAEYAAISHTFLEWKLDQLGAAIPGYAIDQVHLARNGGWMDTSDPVGFAKLYMSRHHPAIGTALRSGYRAARFAYRLVKRVSGRTPAPAALEQDAPERKKIDG
jgi:lipopolysaccharide biosynthesis protein